jgi:Uma2 family endonuclease
LASVFPKRAGPNLTFWSSLANITGPNGGDRDDVIVVFEVLSPSTEERDLGWKRKAYTGLASLTHYIVISQDAVEVMVFARDDDFKGRKFQSLDEAIELPSLGVSLPVAEIYRDTGLTA